MNYKVLQSEATECGLACLVIIARLHGMPLGLLELRRRFPSSLKGTTLKRLIDIAHKIGFQARPLRLEPESLRKLKLPCVLHWDMNHFVVLTGVGRNSFTIFDPAIGKRKLDPREISQHFTGVAMELAPRSDFIHEKSAPSVTLRQLTGTIKGLWGALGQILLLSLALQVFVILAPFLMQWVVDQVLVSADRDLLIVLGVGFLLAVFLQMAIGLLRGWSVIYLSSRLGLQWMGNVFAHLLRLPLDFFEKRSLGDITSRMSSVQAIQRTVTAQFVEAFIDGVLAVATLCLMVIYSWKLTAVTLVAVLIYAGFRLLAFSPLRESTELQLVSAAKQQTHLMESLRGIQSLKVAGQEFLRHAVYNNLMVDTVNSDVRLARMQLGFNIASQLVFGVERIVVIWIGAILVLQNVFSVGMLIAFLSYKELFAQRLGAIIDKWIEFRMLRLHGERLADIVLMRPDDDEGRDGTSGSFPSSFRIEVEGLSFRYGEDEPWVLKDCSFTIEPGESVAVIGASGCGKTTLIKLLLGLLRPTEGAIRIGSHDLQSIGSRNIRAIVGAVMQDDQLFAGSVSENISFFDSDCDQARIEAAARQSAVHEEIASMPMGYHSLIGDMGSTLSGGQKQRVILARALYRNPKLLFLDEATSHLDVMKERSVNEAVKRLHLTRVIVAHRPETIASADRVLVLEGGRIAQELPSECSAQRPILSPTQPSTAT